MHFLGATHKKGLISGLMLHVGGVLALKIMD
jgi:hypothetical protein